MKKRICLFILMFGAIVMAHTQTNKGLLEQTFKADKADNIKVLVHIIGGKLNIIGGNNHLANVKLNYNKKEWSPSVSYSESDDLGKLIVKVTSDIKEKHIGDDNNCDIKLNSKYNYSLGIVLGAGIANLNFENFNIAKALFKLGVGSFNINLANTSLPLLKVDAGIGEATIDLSGNYNNDLKAQINAGIGEIKIIVPENIGVKFVVSGFLGDVDTPGYKKQGSEYVNSHFGNTKHSITVRIKGAIGSINIIEK